MIEEQVFHSCIWSFAAAAGLLPMMILVEHRRNLITLSRESQSLTMSTMRRYIAIWRWWRNMKQQREFLDQEDEEEVRIHRGWLISQDKTPCFESELSGKTNSDRFLISDVQR